MKLLPISEIRINQKEIESIEEVMKSIFRMITFSRVHLADDLLNNYLAMTTNLRELLSIKNAQMEAQNPKEAASYVLSLNKTLATIIYEIKNQVDFNSEIQLFQVFRSISPESHSSHPNRYRDKLVQIGQYICPEPHLISSLVSQLIYNIGQIKNPVIRSIYFHHELIRIHPFIDGNGRTTRIAKNWILMYNLYPPIFIRDDEEKTEYIDTLSKSFALLDQNPYRWNHYLDDFFNQEIRRLRNNANLIYKSVKELGTNRNAL